MGRIEECVEGVRSLRERESGQALLCGEQLLFVSILWAERSLWAER